MPTSPVLLIGAPALAGPLKAAGVVVLIDGPPDRDFIVVVGRLASESIPAVRTYIAQGKTVLLLVGANEDASSPPQNVRVVRLPVLMDELLTTIGAGAVGGVVGTAEVGADLSVRPTKARDALGLFHAKANGSGPTTAGDGAEVTGLGVGQASAQITDATDRRGPEPLSADELITSSGPPVAKVPGPWDLRPTAPLQNTQQEARPAVMDVPPPGNPSPLSVYDDLAPAPQVHPEMPPATPVDMPRPQPSPSAIAYQPAPAPRNATANAYRGPVVRQFGATIICFAGKGGVGKSSLALALGEQASSLGLRSIVVDANRGQGDLRKYLRVNQAYLPSVVDAATSGDPTRAITTPERLASARPAGLPVPSFATVLAPTDTQVDPSLITPEVYREVVDAVRGLADLVIVDTQIVEATDIGGMVDDFMVPELVSGAWGLGISDPSVGADNLLRRIYMLSARGVRPDRLMVCLNRVEPSSGLNQEAMAKLVEPYATWMGAVGIDPRVTTAFESGAIPTSPALEELLGRVLGRVTGIAPVARAQPTEDKPKKRIFRWKK